MQETFTRRDREIKDLFCSKWCPAWTPRRHGAGQGNLSPWLNQGRQSKEKTRECSIVRKEVNFPEGQDSKEELKEGLQYKEEFAHREKIHTEM